MRPCKLLLSACIMAMILYAGRSVGAQDLLVSLSAMEDARRAVRIRDYALAARIFSRLAEAGDVDAQCQLAALYETGKGVVKNEATALEWYKKAAEKGSPRARYNVGLMLGSGRGVPRDKPVAVALSALDSARQSAKQAMGTGDYPRALAEYTLLAQQEDPEAEYQLGSFYEAEIGRAHV